MEPFGEWRADYRTGQLCALIINIAKSLTGKKGTYTLTTPQEFMLQESIEKEGLEGSKEDSPPPPMQSIEEMKEVLKSIARYASKSKATIKRKKR